MVTTFSPPTRAKKPKKSNLPVILYSVIGVLVVGLGYLGYEYSNLKNQHETFRASVVKVAEALGLSSITPDVIAAPEAVESLATSAAAKVTEASDAIAEQEKLQGEVTRLQAESAALQQQVDASVEQVDRLRTDASAKASEVTALQKKYDADTARLRTAIDDLNAQVASLEKELVAADPSASGSEEVASADAVVADAAVAEADTSDDPKPAADAEATDTEPAPVDAPAKAGSNRAYVIPAGQSMLFKTVRYNADNGKLNFLTLDDRVLTYSGVPTEIFDSLTTAPVFDIFYRFQIMDLYESKPKDRDLLPTIKH